MRTSTGEISLVGLAGAAGCFQARAVGDDRAFRWSRPSWLAEEEPTNSALVAPL